MGYDVTMKLALDFDGVLSDTIQSWVNKYNQVHYADLDKDLITHRDIDMWGFYKKFDMTLDECFDYFNMAWSDWQNLKPQENHLPQKTKMLNNILEVDVVTAVVPEYLENIRKWLDWNQIVYGELIHSNDKEKLDYDIYVDDADRNIQKVYDAGKIGLLYNQAWNRDMKSVEKLSFDSNSGMIRRVYNMYDVIDVVRDLVNEEQTD